MPIWLRMPVANISMRVWIGIHQIAGHAGRAQQLVEFVLDLVEGHAGTPLVLRLEGDDGLGHGERRRVGGGARAADLAIDVLDFGEVAR